MHWASETGGLPLAMTWKKERDRWTQIVEPGQHRLMAVWRGKNWVVIRNFWKPSVLQWDFPVILGKWKTAREAKQFCEEFYAAEEGLKPENNLQEHQNGDEKGLSAKTSRRHRVKRGREVKEEKVNGNHRHPSESIGNSG